jgi:uncharacterized protein
LKVENSSNPNLLVPDSTKQYNEPEIVIERYTMNINKSLIKNALAVTIFFLAIIVLFPWSRIHWGSFTFTPAETITVTGEARSQERNQVATFNAGVTAVGDDKQVATEEVNQKMTEITEAVKNFGIPEKDIQTQNLNIFQMEEPITIDGRQRSEPGQWRANNTIAITLREVDRASELADILTGSGATEVYGPNFTVDETAEAEVELTNQAIVNATKKAEAMAAASNKSLGDVISIVEGSSGGGPILMEARGLGGGGGAPIEPGTSSVYQSVTVTFELK